MKLIIGGIAIVCLTGAPLFAQQKVVLTSDSTKVYISRTMEILTVVSDHELNTSLQFSHPYASYSIKNDTLVIKEEYNWYGRNKSSGHTVEYHNYKILSYNADTIILKNTYHGDYTKTPEDWEDPLVFINLEMLKQTVSNFKYLKLNTSSGMGGYSIAVEVDSIGRVNYQEVFSDIFGNSKPPIKFVGYFSPVEFEHFKDILSKSLLTKLPIKRGCGIDAARVDFQVFMNNKKFTTEGCLLYYPQRLLLRYLVNLSGNQQINHR